MELKNLNLPDPSPRQKRIVLVGAGFAGVEFCNRLRRSKSYQVVLLERNNYHQFQPLFYQVAMSGLEPASICFPIRKLYQNADNIFIRCANVERIDQDRNCVHTDQGVLHYDFLVLGMGSMTNYFGNDRLERHTISMKSISEAIYLRNQILLDLEKALLELDFDDRQPLLDIVIVGGGPTGVELAGALAEMKHYIVPKDYRELDQKEIDIYLVQSGKALLAGMSSISQQKAERMLREMGVKVVLGDRVTDFDGVTVTLKSGAEIPAYKVIWAAGVTCNQIAGIRDTQYGKGNRLLVDLEHRLIGAENIFCIGDQALMASEENPLGHPQLAQVAIQSARNLARNFRRLANDKPPRTFRYKDYGVMATIGRHKAVADLKAIKVGGFLAWLIWLVVHLRAIIGVRKKVFVLLNWMANYITYDQSLRLIIKPHVRRADNSEPSQKITE